MNSAQAINQRFTWKRRIGKGSCGEVFLVEENNNQYALKQIDKSTLAADDYLR